MPYPSLSEYQAAIQHPHLFFRDPDLAGSTVEVDTMGTPRPRSGGFAVTYRLSNGSRSWAVRCFHREVPDLEQRYAAISRFLQAAASPAFVQFQYLPDEILVGGRRYPVVKMAWVEGQTLGSYVNINAKDRRKMDLLAGAFRRTVGELDRLGVAHGDLQHGNIVVKDGQVLLIDYDGMFVPGMTQGRSNELGHVNYQSPLRSEADFSAGLDHFSSVVIAMGLEAVAQQPDLWATYSTGENLLFERRDFIKPAKSALVQDLRALPGLRDRIDQLDLLCRTPLSQLPRLEEFLSGTVQIATSQTVSLPIGASVRLRQYDVVRAVDRESVLLHEGDRIEVVGLIVGVTHRTTRTYRAKPYVMLDFGDWRQGAFRLMLWSEALDQFAAAGVDVDGFEGRWVSVTGLIEVFQSGTFSARPQIVVGDPTEIRLLTGEAEAEDILSEAVAGYQASQPAEAHRARNSEQRDALKNLVPAALPARPTPASPARPNPVSSTPAQGNADPTTSRRRNNQAIAQQLASGVSAAHATSPAVPQSQIAKTAWDRQRTSSTLSTTPPSAPTNPAPPAQPRQRSRRPRSLVRSAQRGPRQGIMACAVGQWLRASPSRWSSSFCSSSSSFSSTLDSSAGRWGSTYRCKYARKG
ncbi:MAG: hypothetical protein M3Q03_03290 [Chloroflexota bacterium]|nr:hypothetical protein [Chloroflexota bacterium]